MTNMRLVKPIGRCALVLALSLYAEAVPAGVVVVVSAKSPAVELSGSQVEDIFLCKLKRFPDGRDAVPIDQEEGTAVRDEFYAKYTGRSFAQIKAYWSKIIFTGRGMPPKAVPNSSEVKKQLDENPNAIGYIEQSEVDRRVRVVVPE